MKVHIGADIVGRLSRWLPVRRWQAAHWLGKVFAPRRPFIGRFQSGFLEVHPGEIASSAAFFTGFYEREVTIWSLEQIRNDPPSLVVDVGANFGYYPLLFGLRSGGKTESIAFEPDPGNFAWLSRNLALNPGIKVTAVQLAVGDVDGQIVPFETAKVGHNLWAKVGGQGTNEHTAATIDVPTTTLDSYLDERGIASVPVTLIDVEGYEARVLLGMSKGIAARRYQRVMVEFHPWAFPDPSAEAHRLADLFLSAGYTGYRFRHYSGSHSDKDAAYFRLEWDDAILGPLTFNDMTSWEHYLFIVDGSADGRMMIIKPLQLTGNRPAS